MCNYCNFANNTQWNYIMCLYLGTYEKHSNPKKTKQECRVQTSECDNTLLILFSGYVCFRVCIPKKDIWN